VRAISLWQPWASAVAVGSKRFETRSWPFPKNLEGEVIAIHASKRWQRDEREWAEDLQELGFNLGFEAGSTPPLGAIVATARLARCFPTEHLYPSDFAPFADWSDPKQVEYQLGNYAPGRVAWKFSEVRRLDVPIPCIGRQGFWNLEPEVVRAVNEQFQKKAEGRG
jgi:activating signal cointegrator 1